MKISFFLIWMGPISTKWYEENNIPYTEETIHSTILNKKVTLKNYTPQYCCGRIDIYGIPEDHPLYCPYSNHELWVPIMEDKSWRLLQEYLNKLKLDFIPTAKEIFDMFEKETGHKIKWWDND